MTVEDFLGSVQPNLTILAALFGALFLFLKLFWHFLSYEKELREENLNRVKDLLSNSLDIQIVEPLQKELGNNIMLGYRYAVSLFYPKSYNPSTQQKDHTLIVDNGTNVAEIANKDLTEIVANLSGQNVAQKTGQDLFIFLEKRYQKTAVFIAQYEKIKFCCRMTWSSCLILGLLSAVGMPVYLIHDNLLLIHFWIFTSASIAILGLYFFTKLFWCRHNLIKDWEKLKIYGE